MNPDPPQTLAPTTTSPPPSKGLRSGSVGLLASVALGLSSVAPAYSIAVTLGFVTMAVGHLAPAALLLGFVPILLTAFAFRELNKDMPDCGTTFVWTTRAFGPSSGWLLGGWVTQFATVTAMAALSQVGAGYLLGLLGLDSLASDETAVAVTAALLIGAITVIAYRGLQLAAVVQYVLLALQLVALFGFGAAALARHGALTPSLAWFDPFGFDSFGAFAKAVLLCLYIYWGWDALLTVNEETRDSERTPAGPRSSRRSSSWSRICSRRSPRSASRGRAPRAWGSATPATRPTSCPHSDRPCSARHSRRASSSPCACPRSPRCSPASSAVRGPPCR